MARDPIEIVFFLSNSMEPHTILALMINQVSLVEKPGVLRQRIVMGSILVVHGVLVAPIALFLQIQEEMEGVLLVHHQIQEVIYN